MPIDIVLHPEITSGPLFEYGFHKVQSQTKSVLVNIIQNFFSAENTLLKSDIPDLAKVQSTLGQEIQKVYVARDFPYTQRKFPLIVTGLGPVTEKKAYLGTDDFLYLNKTTTDDGDSYSDVYAGMADLTANILIATESPDMRMLLADLLHLCFSHYSRWHFIYEYSDGSSFSIVPATSTINFGEEQEITGDSQTQLVYITALAFNCFVEYSFVSGDWERYSIITGASMLKNSGPITTTDADGNVLST